MAIKGKKKSRGSQARRRPATAPRPVITGGRRAPWYKTPGGRISLALGIIAALIIGFVLWNNAQKNADDLERRQNAVDDYTGELRTLLQTLTPPAAEMQNVTPVLKGKALDKLAKDSKSWVKNLENGANQAVSLVPPPRIQSTGQLFNESVQLYLTAAKTFQTAATLDEGKAQRDTLARAAEVRDRASAIWAAAVAQLDDERKAAELDASGLRIPSAPTG